jgi:uncharacterized repeat protein (TIGR03803 family)
MKVFFARALFAGLCLMSVDRAMAQVFATLHNFTASRANSSNFFTNSDGASPEAGLLLSGNALYGTASLGGTNGSGTVFSVNTTGAAFTTLHSFATGNFHASFFSTNGDGAFPEAGLIISGNTLEGTGEYGGTNGSGTVFAITTNGTGFAALHHFTALNYTNASGVYTNGDGVNVQAGVILSGGMLYGTASYGGTNGNGAVFAVNTNGTGFTTLHSFSAVSNNTNSDGANPFAGLVLSGNTLYGTASAGGTNGSGTVFAVNTNGTGFTTLHSFSAVSNNTNHDGANPHAGLVLSGNTLYGTAYDGGTNGSGAVFAINTNGTGFTVLHGFTTIASPNYTNSDGANPFSGLIISGNTLYGTAYDGGTHGNGAAFAVNTNGTGFTTLHNFTAISNNTNSDGANPFAGLILSGNTLYGTAYDGGANGNGTVFIISFTPELAMAHVGTNVLLTWPTNVAGFDYSGYGLQATTNLASASAWGAVSPTPAVVNGQYTVTNLLSGKWKFYRLSQ